MARVDTFTRGALFRASRKSPGAALADEDAGLIFFHHPAHQALVDVDGEGAGVAGVLCVGWSVEARSQP